MISEYAERSMGGFGSGRQSAIQTTQQMLDVDIRKLNRMGFVQHNNNFSLSWSRNGQKVGDIRCTTEDGYMTFIYKTKSFNQTEWQHKSCVMKIDKTPCNYGGERVWFRCGSCDKRVAIVYGGSIFACRACHHLAYQSQRESKLDRLTNRADKIRAKLSWTRGVLNGTESKPKYMRWHRYWKLYNEHEKQVQRICGTYRQKFNMDLSC